MSASNVVPLARGEETLEVGDREYNLRPTPAAIMQIEAMLGYEVVAIMNRMRLGQWGMTTVLTVLYECLKAGTPKQGRPTRDQVADAIFAEGVQTYHDLCSRLLGTCYGKEYDEAVAADDAGNGAGPPANA